MKFTNLVKSEDGKIINVNLELSAEENAFFISFAFNSLLTQGFLRLNEVSQNVEIARISDERANVIYLGDKSEDSTPHTNSPLLEDKGFPNA